MKVKIVFDAVDIIDGIKDSFSVHVSMEEDVFSARVVNLEPSPEMLNGKADAITNMASGEIASFPDGADGVPMKSLVVSMQPIQFLHGYDHPWPAGGGANKYDMDNWPYTTTRRFWGTEAPSFVDALNALPAGTYTITAKIKIDALTDTSGNRTYGFLCTGVSVDGRETIATPAVGTVVSVSKTFTLSSAQAGTFTHCYWYSGTATSTSDTSTIYDVGINVGSDATYSPYSNICPISGLTGLSVYVSPTQDPDDATTYAVDWTSEAGTVYGGTLDVVTGVLTVDRASISSYAGETLPGAWISDRDVYAPGTSPTTGAQVVYELATPITYQLTPQEVETLKGQNHVWSDSGDVDLTYVADTKLYIDNKIAQAIAAALNA